MTPAADPLTRFFRACAPNEALGPDDERYVNCDEVRGENLPRLFERSLRRSEPLQPEVKVFSGYRGVGKSSELLRLKQMLETSGRGQRAFQVVFVDVTQDLDLNDLDFPDLLVYLAGQVQQQLRQAKVPGFSASSKLLEQMWDKLKGTLSSRIEITEASLEIPFVSLATEIKNRPSARAELREAIEERSTQLLVAVNDLLQVATVKLRELGYEGLVLIVDGLERLVWRPLEDGASNTHERLFIHRSDQLASLKTHVIYTVPISLIYSPQFAQLEQTFGEHPLPVPMIRLRGKNRSDPTPETPGMRKMLEIVEARCRYAGVKSEDLFDSPETVLYLGRMSGGHPRHLLMFLQSAANAVDAPPITREAAEQAVRHYANSLTRELPDGFWEKLRAFDKPQETLPKDPDHLQMLLLLHLFEYMNDQPWWEVNPVLRTLPRFRG